MDGSIRYKIVKGKKRPLCDYNRNCENLAFREVYSDLGKKRKYSGWSYLCKKHFKKEQKRLNGKLANCNVD